jgi:hypothetical protein
MSQAPSAKPITAPTATPAPNICSSSRPAFARNARARSSRTSVGFGNEGVDMIEFFLVLTKGVCVLFVDGFDGGPFTNR